MTELKVDTLIPADYFEVLRNIYLSDRATAEAWGIEEAPLRQLVPLVADAINFNYSLQSPFRVGGSAVVSLCNDRNLDAVRVLKFPRPSPGRELDLSDAMEQELDALRSLTHPNIMSIHAFGSVELETVRYPFYVMEYVVGAQDLRDFVRDVTSKIQLLTVLDGLFRALDFMHSHDFVHLDIKPENVLVGANGIPLLSDLGFARSVRPPRNAADSLPSDVLIGGTEGYIHPRAEPLMKRTITDPRRRRGHVDRSVIEKVWDLYSCGKTLLDVIAIIADRHLPWATPYVLRYLQLMAARLLDGVESETERPLNLGRDAMIELRYSDASQPIRDIAILAGAYDVTRDIPELSARTDDHVQTSSLGQTVLTHRLDRLLADPGMLRLGNVQQLGLLNIVYPTATHTRREHSLGSYSAICLYINALLRDMENPLFAQIMTVADLEAALIAGLVHDIGHFPMAHDLEEADPGSFSHVRAGIAYLKDPSTAVHVAITSGDWATSPTQVIDVLEANASKRSPKGSFRHRLLHSLIDGPIDADKLDYLTRDSEVLALPYGKVIDVTRFLESLTVIYGLHGDFHDKTYVFLGIHEKGKVVAESIAFARYAMHSQVYWHHSYRAIKAVICQLVWAHIDRARKDKKLKSRRVQFAAFVAPNRQPELGDTLVPGVFPAGARMDIADRAVLSWIARDVSYGSEYLALLERRQLFRRILVLAERGAQAQLVTDLYSFPQAPSRRLRLQKLFQENMMRRLMDVRVLPPTVTIDLRQRCQELASVMPIFLIDVPREKQGAQLEYIVEQGRLQAAASRGFRTEDLVDRSEIWADLYRDLRKAAGKVRVFCHRELAEFVVKVIDRDDIESALRDAVDRAKPDGEEA